MECTDTMKSISPLAMTGLLALAGFSLSESTEIGTGNDKAQDPGKFINPQETLLHCDDLYHSDCAL